MFYVFYARISKKVKEKYYLFPYYISLHMFPRAARSLVFGEVDTYVIHHSKARRVLRRQRDPPNKQKAQQRILTVLTIVIRTRYSKKNLSPVKQRLHLERHLSAASLQGRQSRMSAPVAPSPSKTRPRTPTKLEDFTATPAGELNNTRSFCFADSWCCSTLFPEWQNGNDSYFFTFLRFLLVVGLSAVLLWTNSQQQGINWLSPPKPPTDSDSDDSEYKGNVWEILAISMVVCHTAVTAMLCALYGRYGNVLLLCVVFIAVRAVTADGNTVAAMHDVYYTVLAARDTCIVLWAVTAVLQRMCMTCSVLCWLCVTCIVLCWLCATCIVLCVQKRLCCMCCRGCDV
eukprot:g77423.t1